MCLLPNAISELTAQAGDSKQISLTDRYGLLAAILAEQLDEEERAAVDRLLRAIKRGQILFTAQ